MLHFFTLRGADTIGTGGASVRPDNDLAQRFQRLVQRLLPNLWRFSMRLERAPSIYVPDFFVATLHRPTTFETSTSPGWKRGFQEVLTRLTNPRGAVVEIALVYGEGPTMVGSFDFSGPIRDGQSGLMVPQVPLNAGGSVYVSRLGRIDVRDLERLPDLAAAVFLTHELVEQNLKVDINPHNQAEAFAIHRMAIDGEQAIMGAVRLQAEERVTSGIHPRRPLGNGQRWQWWIPYQQSSGAIRTVMMQMQGHNVESSRLAGFSNMSDFAQAAQATGLVLWPE